MTYAEFDDTSFVELEALSAQWAVKEDRISMRLGALGALLFNIHVDREHKVKPQDIFPLISEHNHANEPDDEATVAQWLDAIRVDAKSKAKRERRPNHP